MSKILIIEDDTMLQKVYQEAFTGAGCEAVIAGTGKEGVIQATNQHPDFILLDIMLPEQDGISVLKDLKASDVTKNIPVAILTAIPPGPPITTENPDLFNQIVGYWVKDRFTPSRIVQEVKDHLFFNHAPTPPTPPPSS